MSPEDKGEKSPAQNLVEIFEAFGEAVSEVFKEPALKERAREFGRSAQQAADAFSGRFKDEEVKARFREVGKAAQNFGKSITDSFQEKPTRASEQPETSGPRTAVVKSSRLASNAEDAANKEKRGLRITSSGFAIAGSVVLLIFLNFFHQYLAYYQFDSVIRRWVIYPILTSTFDAWIPSISAVLMTYIIGHAILIAFDRYWLRQVVLIILNLLALAALLSLLSIYPFTFSSIPNSVVANVLAVVTPLVLIGLIIGLGIAAFVGLVRLIVGFSIRNL